MFSPQILGYTCCLEEDRDTNQHLRDLLVQICLIVPSLEMFSYVTFLPADIFN